MRIRRNRPQLKEQENSPELYKMEASNLSDREFRAMIIKILNSMKKDIVIIKNDQSEIKNAISETENTLEGINSRLGEAVDQISDLEDKVGKKHIGRTAKRKKNLKK